MTPPNPAPDIRLGIIGAGGMGSLHAKNILAGTVPGLRLSALCDGDPSRFDSAPGVKTFDRFPPAHPLRRGRRRPDRHPPLLPHLHRHRRPRARPPRPGREADLRPQGRLRKAHRRPQRRAGQVFAAMFNQRTDPFYQKIRALIQGGELGEIRRVNWIITNWFRTAAYYARRQLARHLGRRGRRRPAQPMPPQSRPPRNGSSACPSSVRAFCQLRPLSRHRGRGRRDRLPRLPKRRHRRLHHLDRRGPRHQPPRDHRRARQTRLRKRPPHLHPQRGRDVHLQPRTRKLGFAAPPAWNVTIPVSGHGEQHIGILKNFADAILDGAPLIAPAARRHPFRRTRERHALLHLYGPNCRICRSMAAPTNGI